MNKIRYVVVAVGALAAVLAAALWSGHGQEARAGDASLDERIRVLRTAPMAAGHTREEMERNYRSCLFSFLPQVGSDVAAEMLRDACRDEYLRDER